MIDIVITDDHKLFAQGLANILSETEGFNIKAIFNDGRSTVDYLSNQTADIAIIDLNMPHFDGKSTIKKLNEKSIKIKKLVLTMYADEKLINDCIELGIDAYLLKDTEPDTLIDVIIKVVNNQYQLTTNQVINNKNELEFKDDFINKFRLSKREVEVIKLIVNGYSNAKIADKLFLSTYTIDTHRKNILQKLDINNTAELVKIALEQNLIN
jgi:DNA-binding NarL/FixJ family response regulator